MAAPSQAVKDAAQVAVAAQTLKQLFYWFQGHCKCSVLALLGLWLQVWALLVLGD